MDFISIIIPVYNQPLPLNVTLEMFTLQTVPLDSFEVIIIDDGSDEPISNFINLAHYDYHIKIVRQKNKGRAAARNVGIGLSQGNILLFCDADRFPNPNFIKDHVYTVKNNFKTISVGCPLEYYSKINKIDKENMDWIYINRFSRTSYYYNNIQNLFSEKGQTNSAICWLAFLVGNLCLHKTAIIEVGGFDETFTQWGFEHFELGLRLYQCNYKTILRRENCNYHIPHKRGEGFYQKMIQESFKIFQNLHPQINLYPFEKYMLGKLSLQDLEFSISGKISETISGKEPIQLNIINM